MRAVLIYSGGMDSTVLLYKLLKDGHTVSALGIDYGQRHHKELDAAIKITNRLGVPYRIADLKALKQFLGGSSQTDDSVPVPYGHYAEASMRQTIVPNRNMIMLAVASAWAISMKYDAVAYAAHAGDHFVYDDCRPEWADAMNQSIQLSDPQRVQLIRPFIDITKTDIARLGGQLGVPFGDTFSCYEGKGDAQCGACGTCCERRAALVEAGIDDPTHYRISWEETQKILQEGEARI